MFTDFQPSNKDLSKVRTLELGNNVLKITQKDPFGFWYMNFERGMLPDSLRGAYTSYEEAKKDAMLYLAQKKREIKPQK